MIDFKPIATTDKELLTSFILPSDEQDCDFSFANLCSWHFMTESSYALIEDHLVIRFVTSEGNHEYFMPLGEGSPIPVIEALEACALSENEPLCLRGVQPKIQDKLEQYFPTLFEYTSNRDYFDYIYRRQDLAELKGKHYQPKRNHVNKFRKEYRYKYEPLTPDLIPVCLQFESEWCMKHGYIENENIRNERRALTYALHHFEELDLTGAVISVEEGGEEGTSSEMDFFSYIMAFFRDKFDTATTPSECIMKKQISISTVFTVRSTKNLHHIYRNNTFT